MRRIVLDEYWMKRCREYGRQMADDYAQGRSSSSLSSHGIERDPVKLGKSKMAEVAFALYANLDPHVAVKWVTGEDAGSDVRLGPVLIDVKWTHHGRCLIWPYRKNDLYDRTNFDALVLVRGDEPVFFVQGWLSKLMFKERRKTADVDHKLTEGTWYVDQDELWPMENMINFFNPVENNQCLK